MAQFRRKAGEGRGRVGRLRRSRALPLMMAFQLRHEHLLKYLSIISAKSGIRGVEMVSR